MDNSKFNVFKIANSFSMDNDQQQQNLPIKTIKFHNNICSTKNHRDYCATTSHANETLELRKAFQVQNFMDNKQYDELSILANSNFTELKSSLNLQTGYAIKVRLHKFVRFFTSFRLKFYRYAFNRLIQLRDQQIETNKFENNFLFATNLTRIQLDQNYHQKWDALQIDFFQQIHSFERKIERLVQLLYLSKNDCLHFAISKIYHHSQLNRSWSFLQTLMRILDYRQKQIKGAVLIKLYRNCQTERAIERINTITVNLAKFLLRVALNLLQVNLIEYKLESAKKNIPQHTVKDSHDTKKLNKNKEFYAYKQYRNCENNFDYQLQVQIITAENKTTGKLVSRLNLQLKDWQQRTITEEYEITNSRKLTMQRPITEEYEITNNRKLTLLSRSMLNNVLALQVDQKKQLFQYQEIYNESIWKKHQSKEEELYGQFKIIYFYQYDSNDQDEISLFALLEIQNYKEFNPTINYVYTTMNKIKQSELATFQPEEETIKEKKEQLCNIYFKCASSELQNILESQYTDARSVLKVSKMEKIMSNYFRISLPPMKIEPIEIMFQTHKFFVVFFISLLRVRTQIKKKLKHYCLMVLAAKFIQQNARKYLSKQGKKNGDQILYKYFKFEGNPFPINFFYNKKQFKVFLNCVGIGQKIILHPSYFNISRYLTSMDNIRTELELQTKYITMNEDSNTSIIHIYFFDSTHPDGQLFSSI